MRGAIDICLHRGACIALVLALVACLRPLSAAEGDGQSIVPDRSVSDQLAVVEIEVLIQHAAEHQDKGEYRLALGRLQEARMRAESSVFPDKTQMLARLDSLLERAERLRLEAEEIEHAGRRRLAQQRATDVRDGALQERQTRFDERLRRIMDLRERELLELALAQSRLLCSDFPQSELARETYARILDEVHTQRHLTTEERMRALKQELNDEMARSLIPKGFDGAPVFPDDWDRKNQRQAGILGDDLPLANDVILNQLAQRIQVDFDELEAGECVDLLSQRVKINMVVDADVRADPGGAVSLHGRNMRVDNVLDWIVQQAGLQWRVDNEAIFITRQDETEVFTRIYDVGMLLYGAPDFGGVSVGFRTADQDGMVDFNMDFDDEDSGLAPEDLIDVMQLTTGPELWDRPGNDMQVFGHQLIATCTPSLHTQVQDFISRFQQGDDIQVNIRSRWVRLRKGLAEEIGVEWQDAITSPVFPINVNDPSNSFPQPPGVTGDGGRLGWWRESPEFFNAGNITHVLPGGGASGMVGDGLANAGLNMSFGFLGTWQLAAMFKAVEQESQGRFLSAIDLTTRNGSLGNAFIGRSFGYIQDYDLAISGEDNATFNPIIRVINVGTGIEARPLVSADRKYVTIDLRPSLVDVRMTSAFIQVLGQLNLQNGGGTISFVLPLDLEIQLPTIEMLTVNSRVMIPDGGSILVGGLKRTRRESSKAQVPVLGNIPFLGRLFSKRGRYELDEEFYLMASVKIFLYQELEAQL